jgi:hypothetical protein
MLAQELRAPIFLGSVTRQLLEMARAKGLSNEENIASIKVFEELSGVEVKK